MRPPLALRRLLWFLALYAGGVAALALAALAIRTLLS